MKAAANGQTEVRKTYKLYIGGNFVRSESGRCLPTQSPGGQLLDNYCHASRKELRDAVVAARSTTDGWAKKSAYLRGQILYRAAEMLQGRAGELEREISRSTNSGPSKARGEVRAAIDRLVYYAGSSDKFQQVFGSLNPVASPHFNFTIPEPTGVVAALAPDAPALVPLVSLLAPIVVSGNSAVIIASERSPLPAIVFTEILATSDLPPGVVNILTGKRGELAPHIASHMDINAIIDGSGAPGLRAQLQAGTAHNLKRYAARTLMPGDWFKPTGEDPYWILDTTEFKTAWHPIGL